jgi:hypothetical protein
MARKAGACVDWLASRHLYCIDNEQPAGDAQGNAW